MLLRSRTPCLKADNFLSPWFQTYDDDEDLVAMAKHMISKLQFISRMHKNVSKNIHQTQVKYTQTYASSKGKQMVLGFKEGVTFVKMKKLDQKKSLASSWEGPFMFVRYLDGNRMKEEGFVWLN